MFRILVMSFVLSLSFSAHADRPGQNSDDSDHSDETISFKNCDEGNDHPGTTLREHGINKDVCYTTELHCTRLVEKEGRRDVESRWKGIKAYCRPNPRTHRCPSTTDCANDSELDSADADNFIVPHRTGDDVCEDGSSPTDSRATNGRKPTVPRTQSTYPEKNPFVRSGGSKQ
jgi:hypothetical protein